MTTVRQRVGRSTTSSKLISTFSGHDQLWIIRWLKKCTVKENRKGNNDSGEGRTRELSNSVETHQSPVQSSLVSAG